MITDVRTTRLAVALLCITAAGSLGAQNAPNSPSQPTFRSSADYVQVSVQARDRNGRAVNDLSISDLQLFEDGKRLEIATFVPVNTPIERRSGAAAGRASSVLRGEATRVTNAEARDGRTFVLFIDAMHIGAARTIPARRLMKQFVLEKMADNDIAAVVVPDGLTAGQDFTSDKASLIAAIDRVVGDRLVPRIFAKWQHKQRLPFDEYYRDDFDHERADRAQRSLDSLRRVVQALAGPAKQRTAILYVSEGLDMNLADRIGKSGAPHAGLSSRLMDYDAEYTDNTPLEAAMAGVVADELQFAVEAASRANVAIYTVDPRGLADPDEDAIQIVGPSNTGSGPITGFTPTRSMRQEVVRSQQFLRDIAGRTGGRALVNTNFFSKPFDEIMQDASHYYMLTYQMAHRDDGRFHHITVRTTRPGVTLTARDGYYSPRAGATAHTARSPLEALLESPMQRPGLTMSAASTVIPSAANSAVRFAVEFDGSALGSGTDAPPVIDLAYVLTDDEGKVLARGEKTLTLAVSKEMRASLRDHGLRYVAELNALPGRHHVRLAAMNRSTQAMGSLFWNVEVPVIPPSDVALSPLVLTSQQADAMPTITDLPRPAGQTDGLMTAQRAFGSSDVLSVSTLVANGRQVSEPLTAAFIVSTEAGQEVARKDVAIPGADRKSELAAFSQRVSLNALPPGHYRADFVVRSSNGRVRAQQALLFEVSNGKAPGA